MRIHAMHGAHSAVHLPTENRGVRHCHMCVCASVPASSAFEIHLIECVCVRVCLRAMRYGPFKLHKRVPTKTQQVCYIIITPLAATARTALHSALWWCFNRDEQQSSHDIMIMLAEVRYDTVCSLATQLKCSFSPPLLQQTGERTNEHALEFCNTLLHQRTCTSLCVCVFL